ncbi:putative DNA-binding transcriptional regulator AlpA [Paraburkholderia sp. CI2]|uniref:helix-turn-helix transcriptional regulator n=1 Tax=Paraburkholderia sp. CI2 TaxID=2723093 RepID=UPI00161821E6|nr:transcriptional regulator [Paraburkholderia sp. CI2]MBB5467236.1 putative DNA-binding transcriptional regulator AlpA [Paraburkholderia sp. CI2]
MPLKTQADYLSTFASLPDEARVDVHVVAALYGIATPTVWQRVRDGSIEKPQKIGASSRWVVGRLRRALSAEAVEG